MNSKKPERGGKARKSLKARKFLEPEKAGRAAENRNSRKELEKPEKA